MMSLTLHDAQKCEWVTYSVSARLSKPWIPNLNHVLDSDFVKWSPVNHKSGVGRESPTSKVRLIYDPTGRAREGDFAFVTIFLMLLNVLDLTWGLYFKPAGEVVVVVGVVVGWVVVVPGGGVVPVDDGMVLVAVVTVVDTVGGVVTAGHTVGTT